MCTLFCTTAPTPARPTLAHSPQPVTADIPQLSPSLKPQPTTTIRAPRHIFQIFTPPTPRTGTSPHTWVPPPRFLPSAIPSCATASKKRTSRCDVMRRPRELSRPFFSLFPDSTSLLWASGRTPRRSLLQSSYPRGARGHATGLAGGHPAQAGRVAGDGGRDSPTTMPKSTRARPPLLAPAHHPATHAYVSVTYARSARSRGDAPAHPQRQATSR